MNRRKCVGFLCLPEHYFPELIKCALYIQILYSLRILNYMTSSSILARRLTIIIDYTIYIYGILYIFNIFSNCLFVKFV